MPQRQLLATDMDGTLLPIDHSIAQFEALMELNAFCSRPDAPLFAIVTGRRFDSVMEAYHEFELPRAQWLLCDVGSALYQRKSGKWVKNQAFAKNLKALRADWNHERIFKLVATIDDIWPQDAIHQQEFKASFNTPGDRVQSVAAELSQRFEEMNAPLNVIFCHDLESGDGMVDILPRSVSKAYGLQWLAEQEGIPPEQILFAGDSGNDLAVFLSGLRSIVVSNAEDWIHEQAQAKARLDGQPERIYSAQNDAVAGLVEGLRHFKWL